LPKSPEPPEVSTVDTQRLKKTATVFVKPETVFSTQVYLSLSLSLSLYYTATKFGDVHPLSLPPLSVSVSHPSFSVSLSLSVYHVTVKKLRERERESRALLIWAWIFGDGLLSALVLSF
jgi:hypothetical protein